MLRLGRPTLRDKPITRRLPAPCPRRIEMSYGGQIAAIKAENHTPESELEVLDGTDEGALDFGDQRQTGVVIEKKDRSLSELHRWYREGRLILDPEWQRNYVWTNQRASRRVESSLIDVPVTVTYLAMHNQVNYE